MKSIRITVYGKVQGVWYRASTQKQAQALEIVGWVRNLSDGSVTIEATGTAQALVLFEGWCRQGPLHARVDRLEKEEIPLQDYQDFQIIR